MCGADELKNRNTIRLLGGADGAQLSAVGGGAVGNGVGDDVTMLT